LRKAKREEGRGMNPIRKIIANIRKRKIDRLLEKYKDVLPTITTENVVQKDEPLIKAKISSL